MVNIWLIYGEYMVDILVILWLIYVVHIWGELWLICGQYMVNIWLIYGENYG